MDALSKSLIRTISFYDAVGKVPLTKIELYKYLIHTENLPASPKIARSDSESRRASRSSPKMSFGDFCEFLEQRYTKISPHISRYRGFYFLKKNKEGYEKRIGTGKTSIEKWRTARRMAKIISFLPYVRMIAVTGSLAQNTTNKNSDIDMLIVTRGGHIWTTRMLVSAVMHAIGKRRHGNKIKDRICLNHYISDTTLSLRPKHIFSAHICSSFVHLWSKSKTRNLFVKANAGLVKTHFSQCREKRIHLKSLSGIPRFLYALPSIFEIIAGERVPRRLELMLKRMQTNKIQDSIKRKNAREPDLALSSRLQRVEASARKGGKKIIFDDSALVFHHPRPQNQEALFLYKKNLEEIGSL